MEPMSASQCEQTMSASQCEQTMSLSRSLEPGDTVCATDPIIHTLSPQLRGKRCDFCFVSREKLLRCVKCKVFHYCGRVCQEKDWKSSHKGRECKVYADVSAGEPDSKLLEVPSVQFLLRVYLTLRMRPKLSDEEFTMPDGSVRSFKNLMTHMNELLEDEMRMRCFYSTVRLLKPFVPDLDVELLLVFYAKICVNSFSILDLNLNDIGAGMYIQASVFNHSCRPNATTVWIGRTMHVRAIKRIPVGTEITVNYVDIKKSRPDRQKELLQHYYFTCACIRCQAGGSAGEEDLWTQISILNDRIDNLIASPGTGDPNHEEENEAKFRELYLTTIRTLPMYERIYGDFHPDLTIQLMRAVKARANIRRWPEDDTHAKSEHSIFFLIQKLRQCLYVTHGEDHPIFQELRSLFLPE